MVKYNSRGEPQAFPIEGEKLFDFPPEGWADRVHKEEQAAKAKKLAALKASDFTAPPMPEAFPRK